MNDGAVLGQRGGLDQIVVPVDRKRLGRFVDQGLDERQQVTRVEAGSRGGDAAGEIGDADDPDAVDIGRLAALDALDIAAALDREVVMMTSCFLMCSAVKAACLA